MRRILGHLTYANVMATLAVFIALGGSALASVIITSNSQVAAGTISGHNPPSGDHANIISGSVTTLDLAPSSVTAGRLAPNSVNGTKIVDGGVQTADFAAGAVDTAAIAPGAVDRASLAQNSVGTGKIINGDVRNEDLGFGSVDSSKVADDSITGTDVQNRGLSDGDIGTPAQVNGADIPNIGANSCLGLHLNFGGWTQVGELVFAQAKDGGLGSGLFITPLVVQTPGSADGRICNVTTSDQNPDPEDLLAWSVRQ
jgi:hypothetical protein